MTRKRVKLVRIVNDSARKASFKKRKAGLEKKVRELTTLCGVNAFLVVYNPDERELFTFPTRPVLLELLQRFDNLPEMERHKKMMDQESYLNESSEKVKEQTKRQQRRNKEVEVSNVLRKICYANKSLDDFNLIDLQSLVWFVEEKRREIRKCIEYHQQVKPLSPKASLSSSHHLPGPADSTTQVVEGRIPAEPVLLDQWFVETMNNNEHVAGGSNSIRVKSDPDPELTPQQAFAASSVAPNHMGLPGNLRPYYTSSDMALPHGNITIGGGGSSSGHDIALGQLLNESLSLRANIDTNISLGLQCGNSGSDVGLPYDVSKQWAPNNYFP